MMNPIAPRSQQAKSRFLREAQSAALIQHPHVATIFHFGEEGDAYFYAMEFVDGEDLERYIGRQGPLSPATALRVVLQVAQALEAAQAAYSAWLKTAPLPKLFIDAEPGVFIIFR